MSCMTPLKCILVLINVLFWVAGAILIFSGVVFLETNDGSVGQVSAWPAIVILCGAGVLILGGIIGCVGTIWEKKACLGLFLVFLASVLIVMASIAGVMLTKRVSSKKTFDDFVYKQFEQYGNDTLPINSTDSDEFNGTAFVDATQDALKCCGYNNFTDWFNDTWFHLENNSVPLSCCRPSNVSSNITCTGSTDAKHIGTIYKEGCRKPLNDAFRKFYDFLAWGALAIAILIFVGSLVVIGLLYRQRNRPLGYSELNPGYTEA